jgi:uncharacterized protein DUF1573
MKLRYLSLLLFISSQLLAQQAPKFEIAGGETISTGDHPKGKEVQYDIVFKNAGTGELKISSVTTTCGCSSALTSGDVVKAGETGTIKFTFNGNASGMVAKGVVVTTNEPTGNVHNLTVQMNMVEPLALDPSSIITQGKVGDELKQTATIRNVLDREVTITEISSNSPAVKVTSDKMTLQIGEAASIQIAIKIFEDAPVNAAVEIKTSEGTFQIPVFVDIKN